MLGRNTLFSGICFIATWSAVANTALSDELRLVPKANELPAAAKAAQQPADAVPQQVVIQLVIFEMAGSRNEIKTALANAGLRESADGNRYVTTTGRLLSSNSEELSAVLRNLAAQTRANVLSEPQIRAFMPCRSWGRLSPRRRTSRC